MSLNYTRWIITTFLIQFTHAGFRGTVRLYRNGTADTTQSLSSGIVQYYNYAWGNICDDGNFGPNEADVICHQLGYTGASSYSNTENTTIWGTDSSYTVIDEVFCSSSSHLTITQCSFSTSISTSCFLGHRDAIVSCYSTRIWDSPTPGDIRLTGGTYSNQGLLEVYCNGEWGTVCNRKFESGHATVACRQLGYNHYYAFDYQSPNESPKKIWLDVFYFCYYSIDTCLTSCGVCPRVAIDYCTHEEDVTIACEYSESQPKVETKLSSTENCYSDNSDTSTGTVRLYRNDVADTTQSWSSGIVQIYIDKKWGNICDDGFGSNEADVTCRHLGYTGASSYSNTGTTTMWGTDGSSTHMDDVSCPPLSLTLTQCAFRGANNIRSSCDEAHDLIILCYSTRIWDSPSPGDIRLTGGAYSNQGLLEVYCNGEWGTVCDDGFGSTEAIIACKQLGYNDYDSYDLLPLQGASSQSIWLHLSSNCLASDNCLTTCGGCPLSDVTECTHDEDVTLVCDYNLSFDFASDSTTTLNCTISAAGDIDDVITLLVKVIIGLVIGLTLCIAFVVHVCLCKYMIKKGRATSAAPPTTVTVGSVPAGNRAAPPRLPSNSFTRRLANNHTYFTLEPPNVDQNTPQRVPSNRNQVYFAAENSTYDSIGSHSSSPGVSPPIDPYMSISSTNPPATRQLSEQQLDLDPLLNESHNNDPIVSPNSAYCVQSPAIDQQQQISDESLTAARIEPVPPTNDTIEPNPTTYCIQQTAHQESSPTTSSCTDDHPELSITASSALHFTQASVEEKSSEGNEIKEHIQTTVNSAYIFQFPIEPLQKQFPSTKSQNVFDLSIDDPSITPNPAYKYLELATTSNSANFIRPPLVKYVTHNSSTDSAMHTDVNAVYFNSQSQYDT